MTCTVRGSYFAVANPRSHFAVSPVHPSSLKASISLFQVTNQGNLATEFLVSPPAPRAIQQSKYKVALIQRLPDSSSRYAVRTSDAISIPIAK